MITVHYIDGAPTLVPVDNIAFVSESSIESGVTLIYLRQIAGAKTATPIPCTETLEVIEQLIRDARS